MKLTALLCLLCGCAAQVPQLTVVNNTAANLDVIAENQLLCANLPPGQGLPVPTNPWKTHIAVVVIGRDDHGSYIGANDWIFYAGQDQVWRVDRLNTPDQIYRSDRLNKP